MAAILGALAGAGIVFHYATRVIAKLTSALTRAGTRMSHARWLIYRDWAEADALLGVAERDVARATGTVREDVRPNVDPPTSDQVQMLVEAHRLTYPKTTYV